MSNNFQLLRENTNTTLGILGQLQDRRCKAWSFDALLPSMLVPPFLGGRLGTEGGCC